MAFILPGDYAPDDVPTRKLAWQQYTTYLDTHQHQFPAAAYAFATASWHYGGDDSRNLHDAWVEDVRVWEPALGTQRDHRSVRITIRLLGPYHDGMTHLTYPIVYAYTFDKPRNESFRADVVGHDDWLVDEVRLTHDGHVVHEIIFASAARWVIECSDIEWQWQPF
jgi:hypothetical protein